MMVEEDVLVAPAGAIDEAKTYLRLEEAGDDGALAALVGQAIETGEAFVGAAFMLREVRETMSVTGSWQTLARWPVRAIAAVETPAGVALPVGSYAVDIDGDGRGLVRVTSGGTVRVRYRAGLATNWSELGASLRQGVVRLAALGFQGRERGDGDGAEARRLWQPYRRMRLS